MRKGESADVVGRLSDAICSLIAISAGYWAANFRRQAKISKRVRQISFLSPVLYAIVGGNFFSFILFSNKNDQVIFKLVM
jgi:hypothetical protein